METAAIPPTLARARAEFDDLVKYIRPELHRYCARMTGSVVDGEDVVQEALAKAYYALPMAAPVANLSAWLFRIAHNKAIDHLRRQGRHQTEPLDDLPPLAEPDSPIEDREVAAMALSLFLRLTPLQRSAIFLKDVMGHSLADISELHETSVTAVKAALHRGRTRLRALVAAGEEATPPPPRDSAEAILLQTYIDRFNARDFDAVRAMLADDVRLDLIGRAQSRGARDVGNYVHRYSEQADWHFAPGMVEGRPAILVHDPGAPSTGPRYFVLIDWVDGQIALIRDYRYARHVMGGAAVIETAAQA